MGFADAMAAIKSERLYQDKRWGDNLDKTNTVMDYAVYMHNYMRAVDEANDDNSKLEMMRKVAAIAVKAMEVFGAPQRDGFPCTAVEEETLDLARDQLTDEQLEAIMEKRSKDLDVLRMVYHKVDEEYRTYDFLRGGKINSLSVLDVRYFLVSDSGGHRLIDAYGDFYYIPKGWIALHVVSNELVVG